MQAPMEEQRAWWNKWDGEFLQEAMLGDEARRRGETVLSLVRLLNLSRPNILEVGCGNGWFSKQLAAYGTVTGIDLSDKAIKEARFRNPGCTFLAGDICSMELPEATFDEAVTLETFSHVPDQHEFCRRLRAALKPHAFLVMTTQNRFIYERKKRSDFYQDTVKRYPGTAINRFVTMMELKKILSTHFHILEAFTIEPTAMRGIFRIINSAKLNRIVSVLVPQSKLTAFKEKCGWGQTIVILAQRISSELELNPRRPLRQVA